MQIGRDVGVIVMTIRRPDGQMIFYRLIVMGRLENLRALENLLAESRSAQRG